MKPLDYKGIFYIYADSIISICNKAKKKSQYSIELKIIRKKSLRSEILRSPKIQNVRANLMDI